MTFPGEWFDHAERASQLTPSKVGRFQMELSGHSLSLGANSFKSEEREFGGNGRTECAAPAEKTPPSPSREGAMKRSLGLSIESGILMIALSGSLLGQAPAPSQADRGLPAGTTASSVATPSASSGNMPHDNSFVIGNDDRLAINVWKEPDLTRTIPVRSDGKISLPLVGELQASGLTPLQLEEAYRGQTQKLYDRTGSHCDRRTDQQPEVQYPRSGNKAGLVSHSQPPLQFWMRLQTAGGFPGFCQAKIHLHPAARTELAKRSDIPFNYKEVIKGKNPGQNIKVEPSDTIVVP